MGIVNGTTNYVLTRMTEEGSTFADAVAEAQELGYAERDPTADVDGFDAAAKAAIIASIAFGARVVAATCTAKASRKITADDIAAAARARLRREAARGRRGARRRGRRARAPGDGAARPPARIGARFVQRGVHRRRGRRPADAARPGRRRRPDRERGARRPHRRGQEPALRRARRDDRRRSSASRSARSTRPRRSSTCRSTSPTGPACSPTIAGVFGKHDVSIQSMQQKGQGDDARLIFVTHLAREAGDDRDDPRGARARRRRARRLGAARRRRRGVSRDGHASWRGDHRGVPRPAPGHRHARRSSR